MDKQPFHFIVEHDGKLYLTHDMWQFDPNTTKTLSDTQRAAAARITQLHQQGQPVGKAVKVSHDAVADMTSHNGWGDGGPV
jgi:hypothetical protein